MVKFSNQWFRVILFFVCLLATGNAESDSSSQDIIYNEESFFRSYYSDNPTPEIAFVKDTFTTPEVILTRQEYVEFLSRFLRVYMDDLPEDEDILEEAISYQNEQAESYILLHKEKGQEKFTISDAINDVAIGNLLVHVGAGGTKYSDFAEDLDLESTEEDSL